MTTDYTIDLDNDWVPTVTLKRRNNSDQVEPATGETGLSIHCSTTKGGDAIADTSVALTEMTKLGSYTGTKTKAAISTALAAYIGKVVHIVLVGSTCEFSATALVRATGEFQ